MNVGLRTGAKLMSSLLGLNGLGAMTRLVDYVMNYQWETCILNERGFFVQMGEVS